MILERLLQTVAFGLVLLSAFRVLGAHADNKVWSRISSEENLVLVMRHAEAAGSNPTSFDASGRCRGPHRPATRFPRDADNPVRRERSAGSHRKSPSLLS